MAAPGENLKIDGARLWDSIMEMGRIGPGVAGGNNRQTLTDADGEGRWLFRKWCDAAGLTIGVRLGMAGSRRPLRRRRPRFGLRCASNRGRPARLPAGLYACR